MKTKQYMKKAGYFTLVELMLAMSIFAVLMLILMQIFGSTQDVWRKTGSKADSYESARIALNIIAEDLANAVYVEDYRGKSFHYYNHQLWFVTKKPYTIDNEVQTDKARNRKQQSLDVEVKYKLESYTENGLNLNKLEYYITTDSVNWTSGTPGAFERNAYDFTTNTDAHKTMESSPRGVLLENVVDFSVTPFYMNGGSVISSNCSKLLPNMVMISLEVLDDDNAVKNRYKNAATNDEKKTISRTFVRVIPIKRGQVYTSGYSASGW